MKLSMSMLAWYLRDQHPISYIRDDELCIRGMRFVMEESNAMQPEYLYFGEGAHFFSTPQYKEAYIAVNQHSMLIFPEADFNTLLNTLLSAFEFFNTWEADLLSAAEHHATLQEFVEIAAPVLVNPLSIGSLDMGYNVGSSLEGHRVDPLWRSISNGVNSVHEAQYKPYFDINGERVRDLSDEPQLIRNVYEGGDPVMMLYLRQKGELAGYIAILQEDPSLTQMNMQLSPIFARYCLRAEELISDSGAIQSGVMTFQNLLAGREVGTMNLERLVRLLPPAPWRLVALRVSGRSDQLAVHSLLGDLKRQVGCYFPLNLGTVCFCLVAEYRIPFLKPLTGTASIGASIPFSDLKSIPVRRQQAEFALSQSEDVRGVFLCEDHACDYLLRAFRSMELTSSLLHPALEKLKSYDGENQGELRRTLSVYLKNERNQLLAAEELHIHPNTMRYRLNRIREVAGLTLEDAEELKYLRLSDWLEM